MDLSGLLMINSAGNLVLTSQNKTILWSSNSNKEAQNLVIHLLDSGNLVLSDEKDGNSEIFLRQSFDHPTGTLLPGMKLGWDLRTGLHRQQSAWKSQDDPSPGDFTLELVLNNYPELIMLKGYKMDFPSEPWNGLRHNGEAKSSSITVFELNFISNEEDIYFSYNI
ncbi:hypothetical protein SLA2020_122020 [Shorea laevis]